MEGTAVYKVRTVETKAGVASYLAGIEDGISGLRIAVPTNHFYDEIDDEVRTRLEESVAVFEVARGGILREGLGYERNDVAVVLNVQPDHLGLRGIDTVEQLADVKAVVVEAVPRDGHAVLNADDPLVRAMRRRCSGQVVWFSMAEPGSEVREMIDTHCRRGGKALVLEPSDRGEMIVVKHGRREMQLAWTHLLPATFGGRARMNVQNALAAAAAAFGAGAPLHDIRQGLRTFSTNYYLSPGRLNEVEVNGVNVIVDYCHNAPGMRMLGDFVDRVGESLASSSELGKPQRIGVIATAGDRRDEDMRELGEVAAQHFDVLVVREDVALRGRERGQTAALDAGWRAARGRFIVSLDADLQNDPADIPKMMEALQKRGSDMVIGVRVNRQDTLARKIQSKIGNGVRNWITGDRITDTGCSLKLVRSEAIEQVRLFTGMHRFLPTLVRMQGFRVDEMPVNHRSRQFGVSKYGAMNRAFRGLADCLAVRWMAKRNLQYRVKEEG